ncbi:hypothetical protein MPSYJ_21090 [Mycolicibacterium psychrotolerans]|uniref:Uncharacterized protein n=1 Tax=Mycolicibacterium psychrotolerans TaxID=216929 RepID=A0A7I7M8U5_9MYCO|nr:hypothetical protein MPSYJ_21090 [Mycolicibacterium psychrotolerans]
MGVGATVPSAIGGPTTRRRNSRHSQARDDGEPQQQSSGPERRTLLRGKAEYEAAGDDSQTGDDSRIAEDYRHVLWVGVIEKPVVRCRPHGLIRQRREKPRQQLPTLRHDAGATGRRNAAQPGIRFGRTAAVGSRS